MKLREAVRGCLTGNVAEKGSAGRYWEQQLAAFPVFSIGLGCLSFPHASVLLLADLQLQCYSLQEAFFDHS